MITQDLKLVILAQAGRLPLVEADQKAKVNIMIVVGREIQKRILHVHSGVTILHPPIQEADRNQVQIGIIIIILGEILLLVVDKAHRTGVTILPAVHSVLLTVALEAVRQEVCHLEVRLAVEVVEDRVQGVGINFKKIYV